MGTLKSFSSAAQGLIVNGVMLGKPVQNEEEFLWNDSMLPNGIIDEEGNITLHKEEAVE
jgi:hypothetical protein